MQIPNDKEVLLLFPKIVSLDEDLNIPLNLFNLGTYLQSVGYRVAILNQYVEKEAFDEAVLRKLDDAFCVGITCMTAQLPDATRISRLIRERKPDIPIVYGGAHATLFPEQTARHPLVDYIVVGEGELAFQQLLERIEAGRDAEDVGGVGFVREDGRFVLNKDKESFDYKRMPLFDTSLLSDKMRESIPHWRFPIQSSRGCPYKCRFCINTCMPENRKWRAWDGKRTADEVEHILKLGAKLIYFYDEIFFQSKPRIEEFVAEIEKRGLSFEWQATTRADAISERRMDMDLLKRLRKIGFVLAAIGAESGSPHVLDLIQKQISPDDLVRAAKMLNDAGITGIFSFLIGVPGETREDIRQTVEIMRHLSRLCPSGRFLGPQLFRPYPGSELYEECVKAGWQEPATIEEWCARMERELVHTVPGDLPWIKDKKLVTIVWFYSVFLSAPVGRMVKLFRQYCDEYKKSALFKLAGTFGVLVFSMMGRLRYALNFYSFPIEVALFKKYRLPLSS